MSILNAVTKLKDWAHRRHGPRELRHTMAGLDGWEATAVGRTILSSQKEQLGELLPELFGYHLLELSCFNAPELSAHSRINHRFKLAPDIRFNTPVVANYEELPLASESLDVVLLHHVLDYSPHPHQVLREANRALIARGHLVVVGFNPWSFQGAYKVFAQWLGAGDFWRRRSLRAGRVEDWLRLLDCEPIYLKRGFYRAPVNHQGILSRFNFWEQICSHMRLPFGGYYIILARKDRVSVKPIKPVWRGMNPMAGLVIGKPAGRMPEPLRKNIKKSTRGSE